MGCVGCVRGVSWECVGRGATASSPVKPIHGPVHEPTATATTTIIAIATTITIAIAINTIAINTIAAAAARPHPEQQRAHCLQLP